MTRQRPPRRFDASWSRRNLAAILALCAVFAAVLTTRLAARPHAVGNRIGLWGDRIAAATERINPNTASVGSLQRLPGIGPRRAEAIVAHRAARGADAFEAPEDLADIRGIGPVTVRNAAPHLIFQPSRRED
jgi:competence protein ComEA